ncbi:hypothetical protein M0Q97_13120 [Candidatus Dojkabacteria bacterium]|jgi:very-short-patch-repair endonuclease|nr:hypothetical protein [Candidatus Dojkabacteria bacterium]
MEKEIFILKSILKHGNKYNYSEIPENINRLDRVTIICPEHGEFQQIAKNHYSGRGCQKCSGNKKYSNESFIEKSKFIHNSKYDYSLVNYINNRTKIKIICPLHGVFEQVPVSHIRGYGCPSCANCKKSNNIEFKEKAILLHGVKYDYSHINYINAKTKIKIICPVHGSFEQTPNKHLLGEGCPNCKNSKGENHIRRYFIKNKIKYIQQKKFKDCKYINELPFDFYLPDYNMCVEFDGQQHFIKHKIWGEESFKNTIRNDKIKNDFCKTNDISLLRIKYTENINEKLNENFKI